MELVFSSILIFLLSFKKNGYKYLYFIAIAGIVLGGRLNPAFLSFSFLSASEWIIAIMFIILSLKDLVLDRPHLLVVKWVDKIFGIFILWLIIIPLFANFSGLYDVDVQLFKMFIVLRAWMVYKIFYSILFETYLKGKLSETIDSMLNCLLAVSAVSALLAAVKFCDIPVITNVINSIWIYNENYRLSSSIGAVNGSGLFFGICAVISSYQIVKNNKIIYYIYFFIFTLVILLSGSFSGAITFLFAFSVLTIKLARLIKFKIIIRAVCFLAASITLAYTITPVQSAIIQLIERRIDQQFLDRDTQLIVPAHLSSRYKRWVILSNYFIEKPFFGYGFKGIPGMGSSTRAYSHNYYVFLLIYSGIFGLFAYLFMNLAILQKLIRLGKYQSEGFLIALIICMYLLSQVTQLSFQYGALCDLFGILLSLTAIMVKADSISESNNLHRRVRTQWQRSEGECSDS